MEVLGHQPQSDIHRMPVIHTANRHPKDASNHADGKAVGKQQAFATTHGVLAKNPANFYKATVIELTTSRATLAEDTDDAYASSNIRKYVHHTTTTERCAKGSNFFKRRHFIDS